MNSKWFKEERQAYTDPVEREKAIEEAKETLSHSRLLKEKLERLLKDELEKTFLEEEDVTAPNYQLRISFAAGERKAIRSILQLLNY